MPHGVPLTPILAALVACASPSPPAPVAQWVWTGDDVPLLADLRREHPDAVGGVHVATLHLVHGAFTTELGLSPTTIDAPRALVVRLDDDVHAAWDTLDDDAIAAGLAGPLARLLDMARARGPYVELQLDADVPVRHLDRWAAVLRRLRRGPLHDEPLWVTSLVAHLRDPRYGDLLRGLVDGHVVQVFDTGDAAVDVDEVVALAARAGLPWRWGVGAFERRTDPPTDHRAWFAASARACPSPACRGRWVFPAGRPYLDLLGASP